MTPLKVLRAHINFTTTNQLHLLLHLHLHLVVELA